MAKRAPGAKGFRSARLARVGLAVCFISLVFGSGTAFPETPQEKAWGILQAGLSEHATKKRAAAVEALGFLTGSARAVELAEKALTDKKPAVRAAAAIALGQIGTEASIPPLKIAMRAKDNRVAFAAADSVISLGDPAGYDLFSKALLGERKNSEGWTAEKVRLITDPGALMLLGFGSALRYVPFAGYGKLVWQELSKDYVSPVHIAALKRLANDPELRIGGELVKAASDKHPAVRLAALAAITRHGDPGLISAIVPHMADKKAAVRYVAAAAVLKLSALVPMNE